MRRRRRKGDVPPMLATFTPADWPGRSIADKLAIWKEARSIHFETHGWPGGALALLQEASDVQRRIEGRRLLPWSRTPAELAALNGERYNPRPRRGDVHLDDSATSDPPDERNRS